MSVPSFQTFMLPVLRAAEKGPLSMGEARNKIAIDLQLSDADLAEMVPSGAKTRFADRVDWAKTYLKQAGLVSQPKRGFFEATETGKKVLAGNPPKIDIDFLMNFESFRDFKTKHLSKSSEAAIVVDDTMSVDMVAQTPADQIGEATKLLNSALKAELLEQLTALTPVAFERLIIDLMLKMGYGGSREDAARHIGGSGDGGVDGVISEDLLGLDVIYLQAKRYHKDTSIGPEKVQAFSGALDQRGARKGVFVTTSYFTDAAKRYVATIQIKKIVLIDGDMLADLMIQHNLGVKIDRQIEIKKIDADYFEEE